MKRFNCTVGDKRGVNGDCMELHESGKYLRYSEASNRILELEDRVKNQSDKIAELEKELEGYKQIAKERAEFIINGEELGYISLPESQTDRAYLAFMRCKLTDKYAATEALKEKG